MPHLVNINPAHRLPSPGLRFTALLAAAMVLMLSVFSASPALHAWLHAHDKVATPQHKTTTGPDHQLPSQDEDQCAVVLFAAGVIAAVLGLLAIAAVWRLINLVVIGGAVGLHLVPRYWLPPLCGPPLS